MTYIAKVNYGYGTYSKDDVALLVRVNFITKDDFKNIVGEDYDEYVASKKVI